MKTEIRTSRCFKITSILAMYVCATSIGAGGYATRTQTGTLAETSVGAQEKTEQSAYTAV